MKGISKEIKGEAKHLRNEIKNYLWLKDMVENDRTYYENKMMYYLDKIKKIEFKLNNGNVKSVSYNDIPGAVQCTDSGFLELISELDQYEKEYEICKNNIFQEKSSNRFRIEFIENHLNKLDVKQRDLLIDYYCRNIPVVVLAKKYNFSESYIYKLKDDLIYEML